MVPFGICILLVLSLLIFHIFLIIKGKTTKEQLKNIKIKEVSGKCERASSLFSTRSLVTVGPQD
jgi:palmitoyltransferase ZDHHC9/14/18/palmitoyltransferase